MTVNPISISSQSVNENTDAVIEVVYTKPDTSAILATPQTPGKLVGYFNGATGFMELYVISNSGNRYLKI